MKLRRLLHALHPRNLRQHLVQQSRLVQQLKGAPRMALGQHLRQLVAHALAAHRVDPRSQRANRALRLRLQLKPEPRREPHPAQHAQMVFFKSQLRPPNRANHARIQIRQPAHIIDHRRAQDRSDQPKCSRPKAACPHARSGSSSSPLIVKSLRCTSSSALFVYRTASGCRPSEYARSDRNVATSVTESRASSGLWRNQHHSKMRAHGKRPRKHLQHHIRRRARRHVVVRRLAPQQQIAHASAREIRLVPPRAQRLHNPQRRFELSCFQPSSAVSIFTPIAASHCSR